MKPRNNQDARFKIYPENDPIPGYRNPQEYRDLASEIYNDLSAARTVLPNGEIQIQLGNDLLRLTPDGKFRSLYPVAGGG